MPRQPDLARAAGSLSARLADLLSDRDLLSGMLGDRIDVREAEVRASAPRADIAVHLRRADAFDFGRAVDARDPLIGAHRQFTRALRRDIEAVEGPLFTWLEGAKDRPAEFAKDPARVIRALPNVDAAAAARVVGVLPRSGAPLGRMPGIVVDRLSVDTVVVDEPVTRPQDPVTKPSSAADAVFEIALDHLARVLDAETIPAVRQRASQLSFVTVVGEQAQQGVLSLLLEDAADPRLALDEMSPTNTIGVTIAFPEAMVELGAGPLANPVPTNLGAVEVRAQLKLSATPRPDGNGAQIDLALVAGSITLSEPAGVELIPLPVGVNPAVRQQLWDAAAAEAVQSLSPYYGFGAPLTFDNDVCGIGARGVTAAFRAPSDTTAPSLALFLSLLESTANPPPKDGGSSLVPSGADGHLLLNNHLVHQLACCLLAESEVWGGSLPTQPTEGPTADDPCCRWRDIGSVTLGEESFDKLALMEICVDNGLRMYIDLRKSGWGWDARVEVSATVTLAVHDGVLRVNTATETKITTNVAWWLKVLAVLAIVGGIVLIAVGIWKGNPGAVTWGSRLLTLGLGLLVLIVLLPPEIRVPTAFDDAILDLLPGGIREHFGVLSFLTDATWDDVAIAGYMTVPNEPPLVAGDEVRLAPGQGLDLDTGEVVSVGDVARRLDVDLVLHPGLGDAVVTTALSSLARGGPSGPAAGTGARPASARLLVPRPGMDTGLHRTLTAFGSSRLVALTSRPYPTIGESDLRAVGFPTTATHVGVPGRGSTPDGGTATVVAVRTSAGRLAKVVVWTDSLNATWLRYRTYDTQLLVTVATNHSTQSIGKPGVTDLLTILNARFQAVTAGAWAGRPLTYEWYWQGTRVTGVATIDGGARMTVVNDRCSIDTQQGFDLAGAVCVVARDAAGLSLSACSNVLHLGRIPVGPGGGTGQPGGPGQPGDPGFPGGPGRPGRPGFPGGRPTL